MPKILLSSYEKYIDADGEQRARRIEVESQHAWDGIELLQGGHKGLVIAGSESYTTSFVEAFIDGTFIRGEGASIFEAENNAWTKYLKRNECPSHEWVSRGYHNGAGFCSRCNTFGSNVFSGDDLGQFCKECGIGTTYSWKTDDKNGSITFTCSDHTPKRTF